MKNLLKSALTIEQLCEGRRAHTLYIDKNYAGILWAYVYTISGKRLQYDSDYPYAPYTERTRSEVEAWIAKMEICAREEQYHFEQFIDLDALEFQPE